MSIQSILILLITTLAPVVIMGWYIYRKDEYKPEPLKVLFITAFSGVLGGLLAYMLTTVGLELPVIYAMQESAVTMDVLSTVVKTQIIGDIIMMLILAGVALLNRFFDEQVDGIVYSVFIGLGFIFCQNTIYLLFHAHSLFESGSLRALFLIPIYFFYAILSGYYISRICYRRPRWNWLLIYDLALFLVIPFLCQVLLAVLLIYLETDLPVWQGVLVFLLLIYLCFLAMSFGIQRIESHLRRDRLEGRTSGIWRPHIRKT